MALLRRRQLLFGLALALAVGVSLLLPGVRWRLVGWARGEAFYQGRPTSYWVAAARRCEMQEFILSDDLFFVSPEPTATELWLWNRAGIRLGEDPNNRPIVLVRDPEAVPVLLELLDREESKVRLFAIQSLGTIGPPAEAAVPALRELARSTPEYPIYREAALALGLIDPKGTKAAREIHPDVEKLFERYQKKIRFR